MGGPRRRGSTHKDREGGEGPEEGEKFSIVRVWHPEAVEATGLIREAQRPIRLRSTLPAR